ncbi:DUF4056 domain-containing protein [Ferrimonas kyonanensis]|uniref:DUF4056 domain-containing protein n=1 Tax=Ferrimonas kyonanensis TaxID=364763 RepID=UPI0004029DE1|nr:DUF4056 domain-containing protein [Ferrimonas kyonanensis]
MTLCRLIVVPKLTLLLVGLTLLLSACTTQWQGHPRPDANTIARALGHPGDEIQLWDLPSDSMPDFPLPKSLRPCCAFGNMQKVKVGALPIPLYRLGNTVDVNDVGPHTYDGGMLGFTRSSVSATRHAGTENNGIVYTKRGGFIDLAHVRDTADDTMGLFFPIFKHLGQQQVIELDGEIGRRYVRLHAFDASNLSNHQRWQLAAALAARLAYFKAESHEIAQWRGYASLASWPETVSAYSPEDLYSNMLGAKLSLALIQSKLVLNSQLYDQSMTVWLEEALKWLGGVSAKETNALFDVVDGHWWDSSRAIPEKYLVLKRHYLMGDAQQPHRVPVALARSHSQWPALAAMYVGQPQSQPLSLASTLFGLSLDEIGELRLEVDPAYQASFAHLPETLWQQGFSHRQFGAIAAADERLDQAELAELGH